MAKRAAPAAPASAPSSKKTKSVPASASTPKGGKGKKGAASAAVESATDSPLQTVKQAATDLINTVTEVVDNAGDILLDDGNTPAPVSQVIEENVDVPALKKKGKAAKGKAIEAAKDAESALESKVEEATGVDVKTAKGKAGKAAKAAKEQVDAASAAVQPAVEAAKPLKGKAAKAAAAAQEKAAEAAKEVEKAAKDPKNRKKAEDFMSQAEETVKNVAGKVGEVLGQVVDKFGEASGLTADLGAEVEKGKKQAQKKGKQVKEAAEDAVEDGKKQATKKGKQVKESAAEVVEEGKKQAGKKGKQAQEAAEEVVAEGKKQVGKKGKQAAEAAEEVKETTKRKAKNAVDVAAAEPVAKKTRAAAQAVASEPIAAQGKKAVAAATKAAKGAVAKGAKAVAAAVEPESGDEDEEMGDAENDDEEGSYIHGFSSSDGEGDADSSDDESDAEDLAVAEAGRKVDLSSLPMVAKDDKSVQARLKKASKKKDDPKGTIFLGRIPHGFYEEQMKEYFSQFGDVSRLRLARNKKTGASKHYAYIEFASESVAEIVADTMNNYLLMGHILKCQAVPADEVHPQLWQGANKKFRPVPRARVEKQKHEKERTDEERSKADKRVLKKESQRKKKIQGAGIDYQFDGHTA